jgi:hypothetical protein
MTTHSRQRTIKQDPDQAPTSIAFEQFKSSMRKLTIKRKIAVKPDTLDTQEDELIKQDQARYFSLKNSGQMIMSNILKSNDRSPNE